MAVAEKKTAGKAKRAEGVRVVAFLIDNAEDWDFPEEAEVLTDGLLDNNEPDRTGTDKGHRLYYAGFADPNAPHMVPVRIGGADLTAPINGQLLVGVSDKALERLKRKG